MGLVVGGPLGGWGDAGAPLADAAARVSIAVLSTAEVSIVRSSRSL